MSFALLALTFLLAVFLLMIPRVLGAVPLSILTESMDPGIPPGTLVIVRPVDSSQVHVGDVVTYQWAPGEPSLVTHRVTQVSYDTNGDTVLTMKGDNNDAVDPPVAADQVRGEVVYAVPFFGWVTNTLNTGEGPKLREWVAVGILGYAVLHILSGLLDAFNRRRQGNRSHATGRPAHRRPSPMKAWAVAQAGTARFGVRDS